MIHEFFAEAVYLAVFISLGSYFLGMYIKKRLKLAIFNPLLLAIVFTIVFLLAARMPYAVYSAGEKQYFLWYEDARSIALKEDTAGLFGVEGISLWRLGTIPDYEDWTWTDVLH